MTEAEWLACTDPMPMLEFLAGRVSQRKLSLLSVACCRRVQHLLNPDYFKRQDLQECLMVIETRERYTEGLATEEQARVAEGGPTLLLPRPTTALPTQATSTSML